MDRGRRQLLALAAGSFILKAQAPQEFEAASIKPSAPTGGRVRVGIETMPGGRISMTGVTVKILIQQAYAVRDFQITGGPNWLGSDRYDIMAKPETAVSGDQVKTMVQGLLASRFQLKFHRETKELQTYALVVAKGGSKLKASEMAASGDGRGGGQMRIGRGQFLADGATISGLVDRLGDVLGRSVIDKTGLTGNYDIKLEWTPDENEGGMMRVVQGRGDQPPDAPTGPSLMTALQEQLGLKLESTKGPVALLVIDHVEKASEN
jgi:uncharacterized protein (TIGR03435 family)